jgi:hypothetical protein
MIEKDKDAKLSGREVLPIGKSQFTAVATLISFTLTRAELVDKPNNIIDDCQ